MVNAHHIRQDSEDTLDGFFSNSANYTIPPEYPSRARTLILCFDGTGDEYDADNSNIVDFFRLLKKDDDSKQMVYYQAGIGTYTSKHTAPEIAESFMSTVSTVLDEAIAWNLDSHVKGGYEFIMQNYKAGDRICIFGFSRGAYTARSLAGMIHKVGVLPAGNHQQVPFAYKMYTREDDFGWKQSNDFKDTFSVNVDIEFVGVWDTVSSVGLIPKELPFTTSNTIIRTFRHAIALDERRGRFKPNFYHREADEARSLGEAGTAALNTTYTHPTHRKPTDLTDVEEVWFAGCHCDVGGGSVRNGIKHNLAHIPLRWMVRECFKAGTGIMFRSEQLKRIGLNPDTLYPKVKPRPDPLPVGQNRIERMFEPPASSSWMQSWHAEPNEAAPYEYDSSESKLDLSDCRDEEEAELGDALAPLYDQLSLNWMWWVLEIWPVWKRGRREDELSWFSQWLEWGWNLGRGRIIPEWNPQVKVHRSVKLRMQARHEDGSIYTPKADFEGRDIIWVD